MNGDGEAGSGTTNLVEDDEARLRTKPKFIKTQKKQNRNSQYPTKIAREWSVLGCDENNRFWVDWCWGATISPMVRSAWWGSEMVRSNGFLGLTNGFGHCSTNELGLGFSGLSGVGFWVRDFTSLSLCVSESGNSLKWK